MQRRMNCEFENYSAEGLNQYSLRGLLVFIWHKEVFSHIPLKMCSNNQFIGVLLFFFPLLAAQQEDKVNYKGLEQSTLRT